MNDLEWKEMMMEACPDVPIYTQEDVERMIAHAVEAARRQWEAEQE